MEPRLGKTAPQASAAPSKLDNRQFSSSGQIEEGGRHPAGGASSLRLAAPSHRVTAWPQSSTQAAGNERPHGLKTGKPAETQTPALVTALQTVLWLSGIVLFNAGDRWWFLDMV